MTQHPASWWKDPLVRSLAGFVLGAITSILVVLVAKVIFPQINEAGIDAGMRLRLQLERLRHLSSSMPAAEAQGAKSGGLRYVFLDLDPQSQAGVPSGCDALRKRLPATEASTVIGDCASTRPFDRRLLTEVLRTLKERGARLIVLDVVLAEADAAPADNADLAGALAQAAAPSGTSVIFAQAVQPVTRDNDGEADDGRYFRLEDQPLTGSSREHPSFAQAAIPAVAIPSPEQPVRRYSVCVDLQQNGQRPTLPHAAAAVLRGKDWKETCNGESGTSAPRIIYTLPPILGHEDSSREGLQRADWAFYRPVVNRCLAGLLWNEDSRCGSTKDSLFNQAVVVVGASNPVRRDWHYTPLGNMVGAEVVINAIRSAIEFPDLPDKSVTASILSKLQIVTVCACIWFAFHAWRNRRERLGRPARPLAVVFAFGTTLAVVVAVTLFMSYDTRAPAPSLDVFIGVLAISLEQYVELAQAVVHRIEHRLAALLGLSVGHAPH